MTTAYNWAFSTPLRKIYYNLSVTGLSVIAALFIAFNFSYYIKNPLDILFVNRGGLSVQGGLMGGILFAAWYTKRKSLHFWENADAFAPAFDKTYKSKGIVG